LDLQIAVGACEGYCSLVMVANTLARIASEILTLAMSVVAQPDDTRCPDRAALAAVTLPRVPDEAARWTLHYRVESPPGASAANEVRLQLFDDRGQLRLRRDLTIADDGCVAAAEGIAMILERFFEEVSWTGAVPLPEMERKAEPPLPAARPWELQVAGVVRREVALVPGLALDARIPLGPGWVLEAGLILQPTPVSQPISPGEARLWSLPFRASVRRGVERRRLRLELGPQVTFSAERAYTSGLDNGAANRVVGSVGAVGSERWAFAEWWAVGLELSAEVTFLGPAFGVAGVKGEVLAPHRIQFLGLVAITRAFSF
jgi:hypothetical protein